MDQAELPDDASLRAIVSTVAHLRAAYGGAIGEPVLVQPTGDFFPDTFRPDAPSVAALLKRMLDYAPVADDLPIELAFIADDDGDAGGGGCGSLACGSGPHAGGARGVDVDDLDGAYRVRLAVRDVSSPEVLTTSLGRAIGAIVLHEAGEARVDAVTSELAAVVCGFGVILTNGAAVWAKACSGLKMAQATALTVDEAAVALALFAAVHGVKPADARRHLGLTQREAFDRAHDWVQCNKRIVKALRDEPEWLTGGTFAIEPVRSLFGQWLRDRAKAEAQPPRRAPAVSAERQRWLDEARALVDSVAADGPAGTPRS